LEEIKTLTLTTWDSSGEEPPLKIAASDQDHNNPFSLAFYRGHYNVAKSILEIAQLQYSPEEKPKTRYRMDNDDGDSEYDSEADSDGADSQPDICRETIDQRFTIENVGQVSMKVNSRTRPLEMFSWYCLDYRNGDKATDTVLNTVIKNNDLNGLKFLLDVGEHLSAQKLEPDDETARFYSFPDSSFQLAVNRGGRTELLAEIIRRTGAGLPLEELVKHSGVELVEKPRYYQGLTVYGKKRKDWATAGRRLVTKQSQGIKTSPLILAALAGCIESVEWFLSDTPLRLYTKFASSKRAAEDARMKHLSEQPGGIDKAVSDWLKDGSELVIHAAIFASPSQTTNELVSYLIKSCPASVDIKSQLDVTPLFLATTLGRTEIAKMLLDAGADQATRNWFRENLLHAVLSNNPKAHRLEEFLSLLDPAQVQHMARDRDSRTTAGDGGKTPLHRWLTKLVRPSTGAPYETTGEILAVLRVLLKHSGGRELDQLDAAGDTVLHTLLLKNNVDLAVVRAVLDANPNLLYRENAVGRTPAEVARDRFIADKIKANGTDGRGRRLHSYWDVGYGDNNNDGIAAIIQRPPQEFVKKSAAAAAGGSEPASTDTARSEIEQMWDLCRDFMHRHPGKRRLVSLHEANDVARRLGAQNGRARYAFKVRTPDPSDRGCEDGEDGEARRERRARGGADVVNQYWFYKPFAAWHEEKVDVGKEKKEVPVCKICGDRHEEEGDAPDAL
jgi:ankyrin repeat protein